MTDILKSPVRVCQRSEQVYFFDGVASADIIGPPEERKAVLALVGQAQRMAALLEDVARKWCEYNAEPVSCGACHPCRAQVVLRDVGVMSPVDGRGGG